MRFAERVCMALNGFFPNKSISATDYGETYAELEYRTAEQRLKIYEPQVELKGKTVLDAGCGLGGAAIFYAEQGCASVVGIDMDDNHVRYAREFQRSKGIRNVQFIEANLVELPFESDYFDVILMDDVLEHIERPLLTRALEESRRVLKPNGRMYLRFPPWTTPYAAHLYGYIYIPWCHFLFSDRTLLSVLEQYHPKPRPGRLSYAEHYQQLNRITYKEFLQIVEALHFKTLTIKLRMIKNKKILSRIPYFSKYFIASVIACLSK
jgi:ubiquinone/menaquinone biosynthesis C-methylase UbiE